MKTFFKTVLAFFLAIIVVVVLALGFMGLIPGLSKIMGANKAKDLGVRYTEQNRTEARAKSQIVYEALPAETAPEVSSTTSGSREVTAEFSSEEMTALLNNRPWKYFPYKNIQVKVNADGTAEISGNIIKSKLPGYAAYLGAPREAIDFAMKFIPEDAAFYCKGVASLESNQLALFEPQAFSLGRVPLPVSMFLSFVPSQFVKTAYAVDISGMTTELSKVENKRALIIGFINQNIARIQGFYAKSAKFTGGKLQFEGTLPEKEITAQ
jgi:hypothetical protein